MSVLDLISRRAVKLAGGHPQDAALVDFFNYRDTASGVPVTEAMSLQVATVYACIRVLSEDEAKLPLILYQSLKPRGKQRMEGHRLYRILHDAPNPKMTSFRFRQTLTASVLRQGNGYAEIQRDGAEMPAALWPIESKRVRPYLEGDALLYEISNTQGQKRTLQQRDVFHLRGLGGDGIVGWSIVKFARETIGSAIATEQFTGRFYANNAQGGGFLKHPGALTDKAYERLKDSMKERWQGTENAYTPKILEEGMEWQDSTMPAEDAQFLESRQFGVEEICRWFRVPPHKVQHLLRATFNNIEHLSLEYVTDSLMPWLVNWEQEIKQALISPERPDLFAEHLVTGLLRGDMTARSAFHAKMFSIGAVSPNDVRELENMNPVEDGDDYYRPLNMIELGKEPPTPVAPAPAPEPADEEDKPAEEKPNRALADQITAAHVPLVADVLKRLHRIEDDRIRKLRGGKDEADLIRRFFDEHTIHVRAALHPALESLAGSLTAILGNGQPAAAMIQAASDGYIAFARNTAIGCGAVEPEKRARMMVQQLREAMEAHDADPQ